MFMIRYRYVNFTTICDVVINIQVWAVDINAKKHFDVL